MNNKTATAGNFGEKIQEDCFVKLEITKQNGLTVNIQSKYGSCKKNIETLCLKILRFYDIKHAKLEVLDFEAPEFVIMARIETAIKQLLTSQKEYLPDKSKDSKYTFTKKQFRFSRLYVPGNNPKMIIKAVSLSPGGIIMDLEDSVSPEKKNEARLLVRNALHHLSFNRAEKMVRINSLPEGLNDLPHIIPHNPNSVILPKCEKAEQIMQVEKEIKKIQDEYSINEPVFIIPMIESCLGVENTFAIACASKNIAGLALGLEDYTENLGVKRTVEGKESLYARGRIVNACKAANIQAIDSVFSDISDTKGFKITLNESKKLGFDGIGCIHPKQIDIANQTFAPTLNEIKHAQNIVQAFKKAKNKGIGVISVDSKMVDLPVVKRAEKIIEIAELLGIIKKQKNL